MSYNPTVVIGHLNDQELKNSINSLVTHVNEGMEKIVSSTNTAVENIKNKLKELETTSKNTNAQRAESLSKESKAAKETTASYDNMQKAMQKATGKNNTLELYDKQLQAFRDRLAEVRKDIDIYNFAIGSGKATQVEWGQTGLRKANEEAERLMRTIAAMEAQRGNLANVMSPQGHTIQNYVNSLQKANPELRLLNEQFKSGQSLLHQRSVDETAAAQSAHRYTEEIIRQAKAIRESESWKKEGKGYYFYNYTDAAGVEKSGMYVVLAKDRLSVEEQILNVQKQVQREMQQETTTMQQEVTIEQERLRTEQAITEEYSKRFKKYVSPDTGINDSFNKMLASKLGINSTIKSYESELDKLSARLKQLNQAWGKMTGAERNTAFGKQLRMEIQTVSREVEKIRKLANRPVRLEDILVFKPQTIDDIIYKIRQLQSFKQGINITDPKSEGEIRRVDDAINKLQRDLNKYTSTTNQALSANNALARSWNYMKNRLAFYFTVGASTQFVKNLIEVRSQYEMNERALGILIDSAERGTQIFNELSQMALISPYTLIELSAAAKQLTAYDVAAKDVVDTTRRLADMAAAVGVPIDRLTYALGQIKAYGYLNSRDARMFANAGIPLVKQLADYYTELEGRMVSTAEVYDKIKKKAIDYNTVMNVVNSMTDEGGKFFNFQAKMADTLKVRLANLTLAWNNMLNDVGKSTQGMLTWGIGALRTLFENWRTFDKFIKDVWNLTKVRTGLLLLGALLIKLGANFGVLNKQMTLNAIFGKKLADVLRTVWASMMKIVTSPMAWAAVGAMAVWQLTDAFINADRATKEFGKGLRETAKTAYEDLSKFLDSDINISLRKNLGQSRDTGGVWSTPAPASLNEAEAKNAWETVREQIELTTKNSDEYIGRLLTIENLSERLRQGFAILDEIREVDAVLKDVGDKAIKINQDFSAWWNLNKLPEGLIKNLRDYVEYTEELNKESNYTAEGLEKLTESSKSLSTAVVAASKDYTRFKADLTDTTNSINELIQSQAGWSTDIEKISEVYAKVTQKIIQDNQLNPTEAFQLQLEMEEARTQAAKEGLMARIQDEKKALEVAENENAKRAIQTNLNTLNQQYADFEKNNGREKALWDTYVKWMKERHISEMRAMFGDMTAEEIKKINFSEGKWKDFAYRTASQFANDHKLSINDVFTLLHSWVLDANKWSITIPIYLTSDGGKSMIDTLNEADSQLETALKNIERLKKQQQKLMQKGGATSKDVNVAKEYLKVTREIEAEQKTAEQAREKGGISKTEEKASLKAAKEAERERKRQHAEELKRQKQEESELQKALKDQLSIIDKTRSVYSKLTDKGAEHAKAVEISTSGFEKSTEAINKVLTKWGIDAFDPKKYAGISDPNIILNMLSNELNKIVSTGRAKPSEIKELEVKIKELEVDAESFNLERIKKNLDHELDKLQEEYSLAIELDADPELGNTFAEMMGINYASLPHDIKDYEKRLLGHINKFLTANGGESLPTLNLTDDDIHAFEQLVKDGKMNAMWLEVILKGVSKMRTERRKEISETIKEWDTLLEKYAEYEYRRTQIIKKAQHEREVAQKKGAGIQILRAIDNRKAQDLADLDFSEFQKTPTWITATGDLANLSGKAIGMLIGNILEYKHAAKNLSPKQIQAMNKALRSLYKQQRQGNPFNFIANAIDEAEERVESYKIAIDEVTKKLQEYDAIIVSGGNLTEEQGRDYMRLTKALKKYKEEMSEVGKVSAGTIVEGVNAAIQVASQAAGAFNEMAEALGGKKMTSAAKIITKITGVLESAGQGAALGAALGSGYGAIIGAVAGAFKGVITQFAEEFSGNAEINESIETLSIQIKGLQNQYKQLQRSIDEAYGTARTGATKAAIANKKLELFELQKQLSLEESRKEKNKDLGTIEDVRGQIIDLENEISDLTNQLVNDMLGISSIGDAAESLMDGFVEALRSGDNAMESFNNSINDMIANMVKKMFTTKILQPWFEEQWNKIQEGIDARGADIEQMIIEYQRTLAQISSGEVVGVYDNNNKMITGQDAMREYVQKKLEELEEKLISETAVTVDDIRAYAAILRSGQPVMESSMKEISDLLRELGLMKDSASNKNLSALQQGIQGITEDTAGALEAYMNGVSQQVYLHSDILAQIRDAVVGYNLDVQTASISQILLQLQSSYQVQMSLYNTITGVVSASGRAFNVELIN